MVIWLVGNHSSCKWEKAHFQGPALDIKKHSLLNFCLALAVMGCYLIFHLKNQVLLKRKGIMLCRYNSELWWIRYRERCKLQKEVPAWLSSSYFKKQTSWGILPPPPSFISPIPPSKQHFFNCNSAAFPVVQHWFWKPTERDFQKVCLWIQKSHFCFVLWSN